MSRSHDTGEGSGLGSWRKRRLPSEPLRMMSEMAEEFGVSVLTLGQLLRYRDGPRPAIVKSARAIHKVYYKPSEMRRWWKEVGKHELR